MIVKNILIDLSNVKNINELYDAFSLSFGFPSYFGKNFDALVDCLFSIRFKDDEVDLINIEEDEFLLLELRGFSSAPSDVRETVTFATEMVNLKCSEKNKNPAIVLLLNKQKR